MVWCGFKPRYILIKNMDYGTDWEIFDAARDPYNAAQEYLMPNTNGAANTSQGAVLDILSNGFKLRNTNLSWNGGYRYIYMAFAESPFKYSNAR